MLAAIVQSSGACTRDRRRPKRKGAAIVLALMLMTVMVGMLAFSIDIGYLAASKAELRRAADAAALAGGWQLLDSSIAGASENQQADAVRSTSNQTVQLNRVCNASASLELSGNNCDVKLGYLPALSSTAVMTSDTNNAFRAVNVRVRKSSQKNGEVPFFFARIFGETGHELSAEATSALATQIKGFATPTSEASNIDLLPFAIDQSTWDAMIAGGGTDSYSYNATTGNVGNGSDGIREVNLYPQGTGSPGNRGTVDIGGCNNSTADIARQIVYGISEQDLEDLGKPLMLGANGTMTLNGDTGISAGVKDELASIIGKVRIIPVFSSVSGNGNNATYTIVRWVGVRILNVRLTGAMKSKQVIVQPAPLIVRNIIPGDNSRQWSEKIYSPVVLVD